MDQNKTEFLTVIDGKVFEAKHGLLGYWIGRVDQKPWKDLDKHAEKVLKAVLASPASIPEDLRERIERVVTERRKERELWKQQLQSVKLAINAPSGPGVNTRVRAAVRFLLNAGDFSCDQGIFRKLVERMFIPDGIRIVFGIDIELRYIRAEETTEKWAYVLEQLLEICAMLFTHVETECVDISLHSFEHQDGYSAESVTYPSLALDAKHRS